jgi:hypothetical protein
LWGGKIGNGKGITRKSEKGESRKIMCIGRVSSGMSAESDFARLTSDIGKSRFLASLEITVGWALEITVGWALEMA